MTDRGFKINGTWEAKFSSRISEDTDCQELIKVIQVADRIYGFITYKEINRLNKQVEKTKKFKFFGRFLDSVLSATYWNMDSKQKGRGTFCLLSKRDDFLEGKYSWLEPEEQEIFADDYEWRRKK